MILENVTAIVDSTEHVHNIHMNYTSDDELAPEITPTNRHYVESTEETLKYNICEHSQSDVSNELYSDNITSCNHTLLDLDDLDLKN